MTPDPKVPSCRYCGGPLGTAQVVLCSKCRTPHHLSCWIDNGSICVVYGCGSSSAIEARISFAPAHAEEAVLSVEKDAAAKTDEAAAEQRRVSGSRQDSGAILSRWEELAATAREQARKSQAAVVDDAGVETSVGSGEDGSVGSAVAVPHISQKIGPVIVGIAFIGLVALPCVLWALGSISTTLWLSMSGVGGLAIIGSVMWVRWNTAMNFMLRWSRRMERMKEGSGGEFSRDDNSLEKAKGAEAAVTPRRHR